MSRVANSALMIAAFLLSAAAAAAVAAGVRIDDGRLFAALVLAPAGLAFASLLVLLRGSIRQRQSAVLLGAALLTSLYLVNVLIILLPTRHFERPPRIDRRDRVAIMRDLRTKGIPAYVALPAGAVRNLVPSTVPLSNPALRVLVHCSESQETTLFNSDERGFNNPRGLWAEKADIALVGDSFVLGACVWPGETWAGVIRQRVARTLALAMDDFGPLAQLGVIMEYLPQVRPRHVFWVYYEWNDLRDLRSELESPALAGYLDNRTQELAARQPSIDSALTQLIDSIARVPRIVRAPEVAPPPRLESFFWWAKLGPLRKAAELDNLPERLARCCDMRTLEQALRRARTTVESWGGQLHFIYLPAALRYYRPASAYLDDAMRRRRQVLRMAGTLMPVLDLDSVFRDAGPRELYVHAQSHLNAHGYAVAGTAVLDHLFR